MGVIIPATGSGDATPSVATYTSSAGASGTHYQQVTTRPDVSAIVARYSSTAINAATSGANTIISGTTGTTIRVFGFFASSTAANGFKLRSSTNDLFPNVGLAAGVPIVLPPTGEPWVTTTAGGDLQVFLSTSVQLSGRLYFSQSS